MSDETPVPTAALSEAALREVFWRSVESDKPLSEKTLRELALAAGEDAEQFVARHNNMFKLAHEDDDNDKPFAVVDLPNWRR